MTETKINPWFCPKCHSRLVLKEGRHGRFMACPGYPHCRYTRAMWTYQSVKPFCDECKDTGLIPFKNKEGTTIPNAFIYCSCHEDEPEYYFPLTPEDFDFACSHEFRSFIEEECYGKPLPPLEPKPAEPQPTEQVIVHRHSNMAQEDYDLLQQTARKADYLEKKLAEREKPKAQSKKFGYKGIK